MIFGNKADCKKVFDRLTILLHELGLTVSVKKNVLPSQQVVCLGVLIDTNLFTMSVPSDKLQEIINLLDTWGHKQKCFKRELQSLLGSLLYISKCVRYARFFLNRLLDMLRQHKDSKIINLDVEARRDIAWFRKFVCQFNGRHFLSRIR